MEMSEHVGLLCCGHGSTGLAAVLKLRGVNVTLWALPDHPGAIPTIRENNGKLRVTGSGYDGEVTVNIADSLEELVKACKFLVLSARADAIYRYIGALAKLNEHLSETDLLIINSIGSSLVHKGELQVRHLLETNLLPIACKLSAGKPHVNINLEKEELEVSSYPVLYANSQYKDPDQVILPNENLVLLEKYFSLRIVPRTPLHMALAYVPSILHFLPALLRISSLPNDDRAEDTRNVLSNMEKYPALDPGYFYADWMNTCVGRAQENLDRERLSLGNLLGFKLLPFFESLNRQYGTRFATKREYSSAPERNIQKKAPTSLDHRFYREDALAIVLALAIGRIVNTHLKRHEGVICTLEMTLPGNKPLDRCGRDLPDFTVADLVCFGAKITA